MTEPVHNPAALRQLRQTITGELEKLQNLAVPSPVKIRTLTNLGFTIATLSLDKAVARELGRIFLAIEGIATEDAIHGFEEESA